MRWIDASTRLVCRRSAAAVCLGVLAFGSWSHAADTAGDRAAVQAALDASSAAWSAGRLGGFMAAYADAPDTMFVGGDKVVAGYRQIHDRYVARYGQNAALGTLRIDMLHFRSIGPADAFVIGRYHLTHRGASAPERTGLTTLLFHKEGGRWLIVSDHSD